MVKKKEVINSCKELLIKANYEISYQDLLILVTSPLELALGVVINSPNCYCTSSKYRKYTIPNCVNLKFFRNPLQSFQSSISPHSFQSRFSSLSPLLSSVPLLTLSCSSLSFAFLLNLSLKSARGGAVRGGGCGSWVLCRGEEQHLLWRLVGFSHRDCVGDRWVRVVVVGVVMGD